MSITHRGKYDLLVKSKILFDVRKGLLDYRFSFIIAASVLYSMAEELCMGKSTAGLLLLEADVVNVNCATHVIPFEGNLKEIKAG